MILFIEAFDQPSALCSGRRNPSGGGWIETGCGDSGGPLVVMRGGAPVQIGVVSWGAGSTYDVYMKVAGHRAWIESVIEG